LEPDFIERLLKVIEQGYDISSGVTPPMAGPSFIRDPIHLKGIGNRVILDVEGNYLVNNDDFGMQYTDSIIVKTHHFRSSAMMTKKVLEKIKYWPTKLTKHGFREEQIFSYKALMEGFKIGVDTGAIAYHQQTMSGGERFPESNELIKTNEQVLKDFTKENKDKLIECFKTEDKLDPLEYMKETNLAGRI
ncbi:MAG: hypothetical protein AABY22_14460, partial [Nanoarchaeota archaeon]